MPDKIEKFEGSYKFLSNFYEPIKIEWRGLTFTSTEAAYQSDKDDRIEIRKQFQNFNASVSKKKGGKFGIVRMRKDWETDKLRVMEELLRIKFAIPELKEKLLATGNAQLIEGNWWNDTYWGVCNGKGFNHLGRLLMKLREEYKNAKLG